MTPAGRRGGSPRFAVATMVPIYHFEDNDAFGPAATRLLHAAEAGRCRLVASTIALLEVLIVPKRRGLDDLCRRYREFFESFPNLEMVSVDVPVIEIASDLRAAHSLRTPDALHLATALHAGADAFVTEDDRHYPGGAGDLTVLSIREAVDLIP